MKIFQLIVRRSFANRLFLQFNIVGFLVLILAGCGTVPMTLKINGQEVFRGSATGIIGGEATIKLKNIDGVSCQGSMKLPVNEMTTDGKISCTNGAEGEFIAMRSYPGNAGFWSGEGKFKDGTNFRFIIGAQQATMMY